MIAASLYIRRQRRRPSDRRKMEFFSSGVWRRASDFGLPTFQISRNLPALNVGKLAPAPMATKKGGCR